MIHLNPLILTTFWSFKAPWPWVKLFQTHRTARWRPPAMARHRWSWSFTSPRCLDVATTTARVGRRTRFERLRCGTYVYSITHIRIHFAVMSIAGIHTLSEEHCMRWTIWFSSSTVLFERIAPFSKGNLGIFKAFVKVLLHLYVVSRTVSLLWMVFPTVVVLRSLQTT